MHALKTSGGGGIRLVKVHVDENGGVLGSRKCRQRGHRLLCLLHCRKVRALQCSTSAISSSRGQQVDTLHESRRQDVRSADIYVVSASWRRPETG